MPTAMTASRWMISFAPGSPTSSPSVTAIPPSLAPTRRLRGRSWWNGFSRALSAVLSGSHSFYRSIGCDGDAAFSRPEGWYNGRCRRPSSLWGRDWGRLRASHSEGGSDRINADATRRERCSPLPRPRDRGFHRLERRHPDPAGSGWRSLTDGRRMAPGVGDGNLDPDCATESAS